MTTSRTRLTFGQKFLGGEYKNFQTITLRIRVSRVCTNRQAFSKKHEAGGDIVGKGNAGCGGWSSGNVFLIFNKKRRFCGFDKVKKKFYRIAQKELESGRGVKKLQII